MVLMDSAPTHWSASSSYYRSEGRLLSSERRQATLGEGMYATLVFSLSNLFRRINIQSVYRHLVYQVRGAISNLLLMLADTTLVQCLPIAIGLVAATAACVYKRALLKPISADWSFFLSGIGTDLITILRGAFSGSGCHRVRLREFHVEELPFVGAWMDVNIDQYSRACSRFLEVLG